MALDVLSPFLGEGAGVCPPPRRRAQARARPNDFDSTLIPVHRKESPRSTQTSKRTSKVAIIAAGFVGSTAAYALLIDGIASEIALIDIIKEKVEGEARDLQHELQSKPDVKVTFGNDYAFMHCGNPQETSAICS